MSQPPGQERNKSTRRSVRKPVSERSERTLRRRTRGRGSVPRCERSERSEGRLFMGLHLGLPPPLRGGGLPPGEVIAPLASLASHDISPVRLLRLRFAPAFIF